MRKCVIFEVLVLILGLCLLFFYSSVRLRIALQLAELPNSANFVHSTVNEDTINTALYQIENVLMLF